MKRRVFLRHALVSGLAGFAALSGLLRPIAALADWPARLFDAKNVKDALAIMFPGQELTDSNAITLTVPEQAENGAVVFAIVSSTLPNVESISLLVDKNPNALVAQFRLGKNTLPEIKTNIKMAETSHVIAVLKSGDKLYTTSKKVHVLLNGCGN